MYFSAELPKLVPDWLAGQLQPDWANRYGPRADDYRLPDTKAKRLAYVQQIGQDGFWLMERIEMDQQAAHFWQLPAVDILRRVWIQWSATAAVQSDRRSTYLAS